MRYGELTIEGCNAVLEAFQSGRTIDELLALDGCQDGPVHTILREARKYDTTINYVSGERLDQVSETGRHQDVIAHATAYEYAEMEDILKTVKEKGKPPFLILLDGIEDPHNLGAIVCTASLAGAHGVITPKRHAAGLTATVAKTSTGALSYTPMAEATSLTTTVKGLKEEGTWFICTDMSGELIYKMNLKGSIGLVVGNEGEGVGELVREHCDIVTSIPMKGDIDSLNAPVVAGMLAYETVRQRLEM